MHRERLQKATWTRGLARVVALLAGLLMGTWIDLAWAASCPSSSVLTLAETAEVQYSSTSAQDVCAQAAALASPVKIYQYVRNNAVYQLYHGSRSGSINSFLGLRGNDVDLASTLIAMLRSQGIPARYVVGNVQVKAADLQNWLRVTNLDLAVSLLKDQGIQNVTLSADRSYVELEHVWVEAQLSFANYRGAGADATVNSCVATPGPCRWVALDPSFKLKTYNSQSLDIYNAVSFDYTNYYNAIYNSIFNNDPSRLNKNPRQIYEEQILGYLRQNNPGATLEDVANAGVIVPDTSEVLPASLPYVIGTSAQVRQYNSVSDHDARYPSSEPKKWAKSATVAANVCGFTLSNTFLQSDLTTKRLTLTYTINGVNQQLILRLDGQSYGTINIIAGQFICNGVTVGVGFPYTVTVQLDGAPATVSGQADTVITVNYSNLIIGGYYLIGTGGDASNWSQVHRAAGQLLQANQQYPIVNDTSSPPVPYVDSNGNGVIDTGELRLVDSPAAMDALTGGLLYTAMTQYFANFRDTVERLDTLDHVISPVEGFVGVLSSTPGVEYVGGTAFSILPNGLLIDMKGVQFNGTWRVDQPAQFANPHFKLVGHAGSSLEHETWQQLTGYDAVSTVRGIQMALANGAGLVDAQKNGTTDTLPTAYPPLGFQSQAPSPWVLRETTVFSDRYATWYTSDGSTQTMDVLKQEVDTSNPSRYPSLTYSTTNGIDGFVTGVAGLAGQLQAGINQYGSGCSVASPGAYFGGSYHTGLCTTVLSQLQSYYNSIVTDPSNVTFFTFIKEPGFVPSAYEYRNDTVALDAQDLSQVIQIRNDLDINAPPQFWMEYILPSKKTTGSTYRFAVYIQHTYQVATNNLVASSYTIQNQSLTAGGGYVDGTTPLQQTTDTTGNTGINFTNALFTNQYLDSQVHNDLVRTPSTTDPVSTVSGNNYHDETDVVIKGRGLNLAFTRTYNSGPTSASATGLPMGFGWTHSYNMSIRSNDYGSCPNCSATQVSQNADNITSSLTVVDERGGENTYLVGPGPSWTITPPAGVFDTLQANWAAGTYTLTFRNGVIYTFQGVAPNTNLQTPGRKARLSRIDDPYGNHLAFTYDASGRLTTVSDELPITGRTGLTFAYDASNRLQSLSDWTGRTWSYTYDGSNNLLTVTNPRSETISYTYQPGTHNLTTVTLPADRGGQKVTTTFTYYQNGKTFQNMNALAQGETLDYDLYAKSTRVTDPRGYVRQYFYDSNGRMTKLMEPDKGILLFSNTATDGLRYQKTDALGYTTTYSYRLDRSLTGGASDTGGNVTLEQDALNHSTQFDYGLFDQPTRVQDKNGNIRTMTYYTTTNLPSGAVQGKLQRVSIRLGGVDVPLQDFTYSAGGNVAQKIEYLDPVNPPNLTHARTTTYTYDAAGLNVMEIDATGSGQTIRTTYQYDNLGRKTQESLQRRASPIDSTILTVSTNYVYDQLDRVTTVTDPIGNQAVTTYDANGKVTQLKARYLKPDTTYDERIVSTRQYDVADRLSTETDVLGQSTYYLYDPSGNLIQVTDPNGHVARYEYDAMNRRTAVTDGTGNRTQTVYDLNGRVIQTIDGNGKVTQLTYDAVGRLTTVVDPLGGTTQYTYDANGNRLTTKDANAVAGLQPINSDGATVSQQYDALNRVTLVRDAVNGTTQYAYDLLGNRTSITDALGRATTYSFDSLGRLVTVTDPLIETPTDKVVTLTYDEAGNVLTRTNRNGDVAQYFYDGLNRVTRVDYYTGSTLVDQELFTFDLHGDRTMAKNNSVTYTYTFDAKHRVTAKVDARYSYTYGQLQYSYDPVGNILTKTDYQGAVTTYEYDDANRLVNLQNPQYVAVAYQYDPAGRLLTRTLSNGATTTYAYDDANRMLTMQTTHVSGSLVSTETYTRDRVGNMLTKTTADGLTTFTYDPLYRLGTADYPGTVNDRGYTYDAVGNRLAQTVGGVTQAYVYNAGNRLLEVHAGTVTGALQLKFTYDDEGRPLQRRDGSNTLLQSYTPDPKNRLTQITTSGQTVAFWYDPFDQRIQKSGNQYATYLLEGEYIETVQSSHQPAQYFRGVVIDEVVNGYQYDQNGVWTNYTFAHDGQQSVVGLVGPEGGTQQTIQYGPFGEELGGNGASCTVLKFTGREKDAETGLYYYRARYYDPTLGRFLTEDPLGFAAGINFYAYVNNNPINANDPRGLTDVYIGGFFDSSSGIVKNYPAANNYFSWTDGSAIVKFLQTAAPPLNVIGHSYGGATAFDVAKNCGCQINQLITIDPVSWTGRPDGPLSNVSQWTNVIAVPSSPNFSDVIGKSGGQWGSVNGPTLQYSIDTNHANFSEMMNTIVPPVLNSPAQSLLQSGVSQSSSAPQLGAISSLQGEIEGIAGGGFLLYPNKPNLNMMQSVYRK